VEITGGRGGTFQGCGFAPQGLRRIGKGEQAVKTLITIMAGLLLNTLIGLGSSFAAESFAAVQSIAGGGVTARVTFLNPKSGDELRFQIVLDLKTLASLRDDTGKTFSPTMVENKGDGHHREATVSFLKPSQGSKRVELVIKDVAGVKERVFRWNVE
jgi:hypothetical protein